MVTLIIFIDAMSEESKQWNDQTKFRGRTSEVQIKRNQQSEVTAKRFDILEVK